MCDGKPLWNIQVGGSPDDNTQACSAHLGVMAEDFLDLMEKIHEPMEVTPVVSPTAYCCWLSPEEQKQLSEGKALDVPVAGG